MNDFPVNPDSDSEVAKSHQLPIERDTAEQEQLHSRIVTLFEKQITFNQTLGLKIVSLNPESVKISFAMRDELVGHFLYGRLHGGVISSTLDVAGGLAVMIGIAEFHSHESADEVLQRFAHLATIDLRVDYLRPGIGNRFEAHARVVRLGKRVAATQIQLFNDSDVLVATGNATYMVS